VFLDKQEPYILFVEDQPDIRDAFVLSFRGRGCQVISVASGEEALEKVSHLPSLPQAIVSDFCLGDDETGLEVIASVRSALGATVPSVLLSGDTSPDTLKQLYDGNVQCSDVAVLHKPVRYADVREAIESLGVAL